MSDLGKNFRKKIIAIMRKENLSMTKFSKETGIKYSRVYHYTTQIKSNPSIDNVGRVINRFPWYTSYILDISPNKLQKQITLKD